MQKLINNLKDNSVIQSDNLTYGNLFVFYIPLGLSAISISLSNLLLARCIGYFPDSELYMSSYSVARTLVQMFQSPIVAISFIVTTFTMNKVTFYKVKKFVLYTIILVIVLLASLAYTPLGRFILNNYFNFTGVLLENAVISLKITMFFPIFISIRGYFLGISLKLRRLKFATIGSVIRLIFIFTASLFIPELLSIIGPKYLSGILLVIMMMIEAVVFAVGVLYTTRGNITSHVMNALKEQNMYSEKENTKYSKLLIFAFPIALSFLLAQLLPGFTQSALALSEEKIVIIAVYTVTTSLANIVASISYQIPQLIVNHDSYSNNNRIVIRRFIIILASICTFIMFILAFTPLGFFIFTNLLEVSDSSARIAMIALKFALFHPATALYMNYKRGKLIKIRKTNMLIFERAIGAFLPYILIFIIPIINWEYAAGMGILMFTLSNITSGMFSNIVFKINVKRNPDLINRTL